jgi:hypothetical protein
MKKTVLLSLLISISTLSLFAQDVVNPIRRGAFSLGGAIGIQLGSSSIKVAGTSTDGPSTFGLTVLPGVQYFITDKFSIGLQIGIGLSSSSTKTPTGTAGATIETSTSNLQFQAAPYARYYMMFADGKVGFFGQGAVGITAGSGTTKSGTTSSDRPNSFTFGIGVSPGLIFFPGKNIGIEAVIGNVIAFQSTNVTSKTTTGTTTTETVNSSTTLDFLNVNTLGLSLGFNYYF